MIACLDVHYRGAAARAACVVLQSWTDRSPVASYVAPITDVQPYEPGRFYLRELPCLLTVLRLLTMSPDVLVIDGYVWLSPDRKPGLGAHLHSALGDASSVIGVAKTEFLALHASPLVELVYRGTSTRPLFVTSVGIDPDRAGALVRSMHGDHRIPEALRLADRLARSRADAPSSSTKVVS
jgi:deoxyribonuclease V